MRRGFYVRAAEVERREIAQLLTEAAFLVDQPSTEAEAGAQIAAGLAFQKLVARASPEVREIVEKTLREKIEAPAPEDP